MIEEGTIAIAFGLAVVAVLLVMFLWNLILAPPRMESEKEAEQQQAFDRTEGELHEKKERLKTLEEERIPNISAEPVATETAGRLPLQSNHCVYAELRIKNTSPSITLEQVSVQVIECIGVFEKQDEKGKYFLHNGYPEWNPANVYWSERNVLPKQLNISIPPQATMTAIIAFRCAHNVALGIFNTPDYSVFGGGAKIVIEVSSVNSAILRGEYYIEYHPPSRDKYEFLKWSEWEASHNVINRSESQ